MQLSVKLHLLHNHIDFFPDNLGDISEEHGERYHQDKKDIERRYQGRRNAVMIADYCWSQKTAWTRNMFDNHEDHTSTAKINKIEY